MSCTKQASKLCGFYPDTVFDLKSLRNSCTVMKLMANRTQLTESSWMRQGCVEFDAETKGHGVN